MVSSWPGDRWPVGVWKWATGAVSSCIRRRNKIGNLNGGEMVAIPSGYRFEVVHEVVFPERCYVMGCEPVYEYDQKRNGNGVRRQVKDESSGESLWAWTVIDPSARGRAAATKVKMPAPYQPVPPE